MVFAVEFDPRLVEEPHRSVRHDLHLLVEDALDAWRGVLSVHRVVGARLPGEFEWEVAASRIKVEGNMLEDGRFHPAAARSAETEKPVQIFGDAWEWTASGYLPYPGYKPAAGALGEYNGKFMCNQMVLRGSSLVTPAGHSRITYRNFFYPHHRWQFTGLRLADYV